MTSPGGQRSMTPAERLRKLRHLEAEILVTLTQVRACIADEQARQPRPALRLVQGGKRP